MATHSWTSGVCCDSSCFYAVRPSEILASSRQSQKPTKQILVSFSDSTGASADETCRPNTFPFIACLHWSNVRLKELFGRRKVQSVVNTQQPTHTKKEKRRRHKRGPDGRNQTSTGDSSFSQLATMESPFPAALTSSSSARQSNRCLHFCSS